MLGEHVGRAHKKSREALPERSSYSQFTLTFLFSSCKCQLNFWLPESQQECLQYPAIP